MYLVLVQSITDRASTRKYDILVRFRSRQHVDESHFNYYFVLSNRLGII